MIVYPLPDMLPQWRRVGDYPPTWQFHEGGVPRGPVLTNDEMLLAIRPHLKDASNG